MFSTPFNYIDRKNEKVKLNKFMLVLKRKHNCLSNEVLERVIRHDITHLRLIEDMDLIWEGMQVTNKGRRL